MWRDSPSGVNEMGIHIVGVQQWDFLVQKRFDSQETLLSLPVSRTYPLFEWQRHLWEGDLGRCKQASQVITLQ